MFRLTFCGADIHCRGGGIIVNLICERWNSDSDGFQSALFDQPSALGGPSGLTVGSAPKSKAPAESCLLGNSNGWRRNGTPEHPNGAMNGYNDDPKTEAKYISI